MIQNVDVKNKTKFREIWIRLVRRLEKIINEKVIYFDSKRCKNANIEFE